MTKSEIKEIKQDLREALDDLPYDFEYKIYHYHEDDHTVIAVDVDVDSVDDDEPDDWLDHVESAIDKVARDWSGSESYPDGFTYEISIQD